MIGSENMRCEAGDGILGGNQFFAKGEARGAYRSGTCKITCIYSNKGIFDIYLHVPTRFFFFNTFIIIGHFKMIVLIPNNIL